MSVTAIALSGGIDSLVAARLLKDQGHQVVALHFLTGYEQAGAACADPGEPGFNACAPEGAAGRVRRQLVPLAERLGIPLHIIDVSEQFERCVVAYFESVYRSGKTPNPCLVCNPAIKFDVLFEHGRNLGADRIATGHYARILEGSDGRLHLLRGLDRLKDQSYFLARLNQEQMARALLPLGTLTKSDIRQIAAARGLAPAVARESQDICFIHHGSYGDFLMRRPGFKAGPGPIEDVAGRLVGHHRGLHRFTIGQRRGINCPAAEPWYVVRIEPERNCLVVGRRDDLLSTRCEVSQINWIVTPPTGPIRALLRVRYRHKAVPARITPVTETRAEVRFDEPEPAVTPGQGAVFYQEEEVLGGGWIE